MSPMKRYESFDAHLADQSPRDQAVLRALRRLVRRVEPDLEETVKWGNACWTGPSGPVAYAHCAADRVEFGFFNGAALPDPDGLLVGKGAYVRHVPLRAAGDVDRPAVAALLRQAARLGHPASRPGRAAGEGAAKKRPAKPRPPARGARRKESRDEAR
jgi:hypothetical protein